MKTFQDIKSIKNELKKYPNHRIGLVPTMGFLHEGHLGLIKKSLLENDLTVVSIYVNPTQFGPQEDFGVYPRDIKGDSQKLIPMKVDYLFCPSDDEMYKKDHRSSVRVKGFSDLLCGISRPHHFEGVTTVVLKLFNIITPDQAYFGQKDAQQAIIIKQMVKDLNLDINLRILPIVRERDGLALSSRNRYLSSEEREIASTLPRSLDLARESILGGELDSSRIIALIRRHLTHQPLIKIEYIQVVDLKNLMELKKINPQNTLVAAAVKIGKTRLIDNFILGEI